jgi:hypothetical protein
VPIVSAKAHARPTPHAKRMMARRLYEKGYNFLAAAVMLGKHHGDEYVTLHLACQGIEMILKGLLLLKDYDRYQPLLHKRYGHNLLLLTSDAIIEFRLRPLRPEIASELQELNQLYRNAFRYSGLLDIFIDPTSISSRRVFRRTKAVLKVAERSLPALRDRARFYRSAGCGRGGTARALRIS